MSRLIGEKMRGNCLRTFSRTFILQTKWCVFFNVQENKHFKKVNFFGFYVCEDGKELLYHYYQAFLLFYAENIGIMRKMGISGNYADPHRRILSEALLRRFLVWYIRRCAFLLKGPNFPLVERIK